MREVVLLDTMQHPKSLSSRGTSSQATTSARPEFVTLPARGGDAVCNLSRSWWYAAEADGLIRLGRLRKKGGLRGRVLLPVDRAVALIESLGAQAATDIETCAPSEPAVRAEGATPFSIQKGATP